MQRLLEPEWLDALSPDDPGARRARADLQRVNRLMGNARRVARALGGARRIADLGAGDGSFMKRVARLLGRRRLDITLVDRAMLPRDVDWDAQPVAADVHEFLSRSEARFDAMVANLFLHHFDDRALRGLLALAARRSRLFVACEPRRSLLALQASRLLGALGCSEVTRHDAAASVRAGFRGSELSALWPHEPGWRLAERAAPPFGHLFIARHDAAL